jgi:hypothetical protein
MKPLDELQRNKITTLEIFRFAVDLTRPYIQGYTQRLPSLIVVIPNLRKTIGMAT